MTSRAKSTFDQNLLRALAHPIRVQALHILNQRVASPTEIAREIRGEVGNVAYHVRELERFGCIELVDTRPVRGATEHFYRALRRAEFSDEEWVQIPESMRSGVAAAHLRLVGRLLGRALESGSFEKRADRHNSLLEFSVDEQGWSEAMEVLEDALHQLQRISEDSAERLFADGSDRVPIAVAMMGFER